ncbi:hypothetical protein IE53DRAFT_390981 [Violaceomyces palustris]|uniref:Uncharacterized protein n=1 Tax=Violaceomyces palustris TaxID=1673888 RepID=A0ACD0NM14_9BASI|nr:hypothetical protein IE53DRAFT_390981 [Violaceomyces palustris]
MKRSTSPSGQGPSRSPYVPTIPRAQTAVFTSSQTTPSPERKRAIHDFLRDSRLDMELGMLNSAISKLVRPKMGVAAHLIKAWAMAMTEEFLPVLGQDAFPPSLKSSVFHSGTVRPSPRDLKPDSEILEILNEYRKKHAEVEVYDLATHLLLKVFQGDRPTRDEIDEDAYLRQYDGFSIPFQGNAAIQFNHTVQTQFSTIYQPREYYGRVIPIIQSSGMGKTRLTFELATLWPTLYVCLRGNIKNPQGGFPVPDAPAVGFLIREDGNLHNPDCVTTAFLAAWFQVAGDTLLEDGDQASSTAELFPSWRIPSDGSLPSERDKNFASVASVAVQILAKMPVSQESPRQGSSHPHLSMVKEHLAPRITSLVNALTQCQAFQKRHQSRETGASTVYVVLDEVSRLDSSRVTSVASLRRSIQLIDECKLDLDVDLWFVLTDTSEAIVRLFPPLDRSVSDRERTMSRLPAWSAVGFDQMVSQAPRLARASDALKVEYLKFFGRPLWSTYRDGRWVVDAAIMKLTGVNRGSPAESYNPKDKQHVLAALSNRVYLDLFPTRSSTGGSETSIDAVQSHMRILVDMQDDSRLVTCTSSEPALALASWDCLTRASSSYVGSLSTFLTELYHAGSVDLQGARGEFLARLVLTMARDAAGSMLLGDWLSLHAPTLLRPITVADLLDSLAGVKGGKEKALMGLELDKAWLSFTHITLADLSEEPFITSHFLWNAWKRGAAIQCQPNQAGIDGLIPVYLGDIEEAWTEEESRSAPPLMTFIGWQAKLRARPHHDFKQIAGPRIRRDPDSSSPPDRMGLLSIIFEFGTSARFDSGGRVQSKLQKCQSPLDPNGPSIDFPVVHIRGSDQDSFPCTAKLGCDRVFQSLAGTSEARQANLIQPRPFVTAWPKSSEFGMLPSTEE